MKYKSMSLFFTTQNRQRKVKNMCVNLSSSQKMKVCVDALCVCASIIGLLVVILVIMTDFVPADPSPLQPLPPNSIFPSAPGKNITLPSGATVSGVSSPNGTLAWVGLRYATGGRFEASQVFNYSNTEVVDGTHFGSVCPQPGVFASMSEDCFFLNVFAPENVLNSSSSFPVLVWFHGGSLIVGDSGAVSTWGFELADSHDMVVVSFNYRLGVFGFLAHSDLGANPSNGAFGIGDQQNALRWVQNNIRSFGGDPARVTLIGESAGGSSVMFHMLAPESDPLFASAVIQSSAPLIEIALPIDAYKTGEAVLYGAGCLGATLLCGRTVPLANLMESNLIYGADVARVMVRPGGILPTSPLDAMASGIRKFHNKPVLGGNVLTEGTIFTYPIFWGNLPPSLYFAALQLYVIDYLRVNISVVDLSAQYPCLPPLNNCWHPLNNAYGDGAFFCPTTLALQAISKHQNDVWAYLFSYHASFVADELLVPHGSDIQFTFDTVDYPLKNIIASTPDDLEMGDIVSGAVAKFAHNSDPGWASYNISELARMNFNISANDVIHDDYSTCQFWLNAFTGTK